MTFIYFFTEKRSQPLPPAAAKGGISTDRSGKRRVDSEGTRNQDSKDCLSSLIPELLAQVVGFAGPSFEFITDISTISKGVRENLLGLRGSRFLRSCVADGHHQSFLVDEGVRQFLGLPSPWKEESAFRADNWAFRCLVSHTSCDHDRVPSEIRLRVFEGGKPVSVGEVPQRVKDYFRDDPWSAVDCPYDRVEVLLEGLSPTGHVVTLCKGLYFSHESYSSASTSPWNRIRSPYNCTHDDDDPFTDILQMNLILNGETIDSMPPEPVLFNEEGNWMNEEEREEQEKREEEEWSFDTIEFKFMKDKGDGKYVSDMLSKLAIAQYCKEVK